MSAVRGTRTPSPFPRITGFQDRPGTSCGITAKSTRGGIRTRKSLRTHSSGPCLYNHFHAPGQNIKYRRRGSNPQNPASKAGTYSSSVTPAKNTSGGDRTRKRPGFLARRIFQFCYRGIFVNGKYFSRKKGIYFSQNAANYFPWFAAFYFPEFMLLYSNPARICRYGILPVRQP